MSEPVLQAIDLTRQALEENSDSEWVIGFSGGKDSTAVLKIFLSAFKKAKTRPKNVDIIYCDTGVENPVLDAYVKDLFLRLDCEYRKSELPFRNILLKAPVKNRFFVKVIGRGYPTPTNNFRWCTKNLRIRPVSDYLSDAASRDSIVVLGLRSGESVQRDRSLKKNGATHWQTQAEAGGNYRLFLPVLNLSVAEVWDAIFGLPRPVSIRPSELDSLYRGASGECPIIKAPNAPPCGSGRFGCWTCTVVRKDHSAIKLIDAGYAELKPYLALRNWLSEIRNDPARRWPKRRSGREGLGPFTLQARREILKRVKKLESETKKVIINRAELDEIQRLWALDENLEPTIIGSPSRRGKQNDNSILLELS